MLKRGVFGVQLRGIWCGTERFWWLKRSGPFVWIWCVELRVMWNWGGPDFRSEMRFFQKIWSISFYSRFFLNNFITLIFSTLKKRHFKYRKTAKCSTCMKSCLLQRCDSICSFLKIQKSGFFMANFFRQKWSLNFERWYFTVNRNVRKSVTLMPTRWVQIVR